ncbi:MerR family transcriptional regulator [Tepidimonas taiwanensis]|uniref:MerR HTH family regulatory protein n=1 Tax=Tepidimonas taiwanensis TaxID=307486 RepID=A0A554XBR0_9BURK|nr:MerR family transcriptional regulator [Tepidimonas taiwanensis]MCX7692129.1 MerR family transcriptional regulator [Tepidimonas taiwanensis]MDM7463606.1 MerR family transcriptional regulator [Tepidimonas taiwanensis]TSE33282.1 MerR HTH family regulatory protein [Tepidimonas taiwanensis]UBQ04326.1 MerR family transcriptional regulator [Tepidimonas taiwanensis]
MYRTDALPPIPPKRYFTIGEVSELCGVKPHVLRYWEQEFTQLRPLKRRGNRRYYQHHEVLMIRRIRELLYDQGFTIHGARNRLAELAQQERARPMAHPATHPADPVGEPDDRRVVDAIENLDSPRGIDRAALLAELRAIRALLDIPTSREHAAEMPL